MVISLRLAIEAKNIFGKPGLSIRDAVGELDAALAAGLISVSEWAAASQSQSLLPLTWP